ncbi:MAG: hypothetical protein WC968_04630 [Bacilli bacterium]|jgi:hypothetical protein
MKKVFSVKKFIEVMEPQVGGKIVLDALKLWALECEGLTPEEMKEKGYRCDKAWLVETKD